MLERIVVETETEVVGARAFRDWVRERQQLSSERWEDSKSGQGRYGYYYRAHPVGLRASSPYRPRRPGGAGRGHSPSNLFQQIDLSFPVGRRQGSPGISCGRREYLRDGRANLAFTGPRFIAISASLTSAVKISMVECSFIRCTFATLQVCRGATGRNVASL